MPRELSRRGEAIEGAIGQRDRGSYVVEAPFDVLRAPPAEQAGWLDAQGVVWPVALVPAMLDRDAWMARYGPESPGA